jgi:exonuclease III
MDLIKADRRALILNSLQALKQDVIFLQETHVESDDQIEAISKQWDGVSLWHKGSHHSCGVAFLFSKRLQPVFGNSYKDDEGRLFLLECSISGVKFILINAYCPNDHSERKLFRKPLPSRPSKPLCCFGRRFQFCRKSFAR